ncbi:MAG: S8/S53 family peptidase [Actinobacteria bacterium]|nr:S8/S53 family peptidase [Actinomycetota bacterium]
MRLRHRATAVGATGAALAALVAAGVPAVAATPGRVGVANAQPSLAGAHAVGKADPGQRVQVNIYLRGRDAAQLAAQVRAVSDPSSSAYAHYLTPQAFRDRYAPTAATVDAVRAFLAGYGVAVSSVPDNRNRVTATGTVAQVAAAFGTSLASYTVDGRTIRAASGPVTMPAGLAGQVLAVSGLSTVTTLMAPHHEDGPKVAGPASATTRPAASGAAPPPGAFVNSGPCSTYYGEKIATTVPTAYGAAQPYAPCGYVPSQLQAAYGVNLAIQYGLTGRGVTVAITDAYAAPTIVSDANTYATTHGQPALRSEQFRQVLPTGYRYGYDDTVNGDLCGEQGWYGEETLDVEAVHAMAPGADITYVAAPSCDNADFADTLNKVVDEHLADIVTNSWGGTDESNGSPQLDAVYQQIFAQAALEGIGFYFSSGDSGDGSSLNNGVPTPEAPANSDLVTAVGGTSMAVDASGRRVWETGWSTGRSRLTGNAWSPPPPGKFQYGAGGGTSRVFAQPDYQRGVVPDALATRYSTQPARVIPDVSAVGDPSTGMLVGETQTFPDGSVRYSEYRIGGTSLSSPLFAGLMALADQAAGRPHGFANPVLYSRYGTSAYYDPTARADTAVVRVDYVNGVDDSAGTATSLRSMDVSVGTILRAQPGYDDITGVGSPNGLAFVLAMVVGRAR